MSGVVVAVALLASKFHRTKSIDGAQRHGYSACVSVNSLVSVFHLWLKIQLTDTSPPPLPGRKRFPWVWYLLALFLILAFAFGPIGSVMLCASIANAYGCKVDEGSVHPCIINGQDYGELLYDLGVMGWFMLVTIPGGVLAFIFLAISRRLQ